MNEWDFGWHFEWLFTRKMAITIGVLAAWWALSLFIGSRIGKFMGDKR